MEHLVFDSATEASQVLARLKLVGELAKIKASLQGMGDSDTLQRLKLAARANQIRIELGSIQGELSPAADDDGLSDDPNAENYRYKDTGYIANSRKEQAASLIANARKSGRRLRFTDIDFDAIEQNPRQAKDLVVKVNLFGKTDWQALQNSGMEPGAGFLIEKIYASIAPEPAQDTPQARRDYAIGLEAIRDRLQDKKTVAEVLDVLSEIRDELNGVVLNSDEAEQYELLTDEMRVLGDKRRTLDESSKSAYDDAQETRAALYAIRRVVEQRKSRGWSVSAEQEREVAEAKARDDEAWARFGEMRAEINPQIDELRKQTQAMYSRRDDMMRSAKARNLFGNQTTRSWLTFGSRFFALLHYRTHSGSAAFAGHVTNAKVGKIKDWAWADKETSAQPKDATKQEVNFQLRVADKFERRGGKAVAANSTQALKEMLGLRDVQSGNWVLKDPNSAKFHVEQTAGAMSDMADMLGIEVSALGLGGRLGMAFGARGTGGKNAARAHYEPVHRVINLTKMGGGGCLGHEVFHAIDNILHNLVKQDVDGGGKGDFVTLNPDLLPPGEVQTAVRALREAMLTGDRRMPETIEFDAKDIRVARANIDNPRTGVAKVIKAAGGQEAAVLAVDDYFRGKERMYRPKDIRDWRRLAAAYYAGDGQTQASLKTGRPVSSFAAEAAVLDGGQYGKYWSGAEEMAARAFQAWLEDRMAAQDRRNDYLSVFADNKFHIDPLTGTEWKPYPEGEERERINAAFDRFWETVRAAKVFETAAGNKPLLDSIFGA